MTLSEIAWTIGSWGTFGIFIDFAIGKAGQAKARDWLETWWLRLSYVNARNFGKEEAEFALNGLDSVFGRTSFSKKSLITCSIVGALAAAVPIVSALVESISSNGPFFPLAMGTFPMWSVRAWLLTICFIVIPVVGFRLSISFTRFLTAKCLPLMVGKAWSVILLLIILAIQSFVTMDLSVVAKKVAGHAVLFSTDLLHLSVTGDAGEPASSVFEQINYIRLLELSPMGTFFDLGHPVWDQHLLGSTFPFFAPRYDFTMAALGVGAGLFRIALLLSFLGSYLLKPFHAIISLCLYRLTEAPGPVFTLVLSGLAAAAKGIQAIVQHFA